MPKRLRSNSPGPSKHRKLDDYEEIRSYSNRYRNFSTTNYVTEFILHNASAYPEERLMDIFDELIDKAFKSETGRKVERFSMLIFGEGLDQPIVIPARSREQNSVAVIMNEIDNLDQSDKKINLLENPLKIIITCISPPQGSGGLNPINHLGVDEKARVRIMNEDNICLFYALELARLHHDPSIIYELKKQNRLVPDHLLNYNHLKALKSNPKKQKKIVIEIMKGAGISTKDKKYGIPDIQMMQDFYDGKYGTGTYRIVLFEHGPKLKPLWKSPIFGKYLIILYLENGHYDFLRSIAAYYRLGKDRHYCIDCEITYSRSQHHRFQCVSRCSFCSKMGSGQCAFEENYEKLCENCNRHFYSKECFKFHKSRMCNLYKRCEKECGKIYKVSKEIHVCGEIFCKKCHVHHPANTNCKIVPIPFPKRKEKARILVYDFESTQELEIVDGVKEHCVNYVSARWTCTVCADKGERKNCPICCPNDEEEGFKRHVTWSEAENEQPLDQFVSWLLTSWGSKYSTFVFAHYGSKYDHHFVMQRLYKLKMRPAVIMSAKIFQMTVSLPRKSNIILRDSYLLMGVPLASLKKTFNLDCENKLFFPHLWNKKENYNKRLSKLPDKKYYCPGTMKTDGAKEFKEWYKKNKYSEFYLPEKLAEYCQNDTEILLKAVLKMREILMEITGGFDVILKNTTIAGVCMTIFKSMFLKKNHLSIVPEKGYEKNDRASDKAIRYMEWRSKKDKVLIQHAGNGREKQIGKFKLDGFIESQNKAIEFLGCWYHGHIEHLNPMESGPNGKTILEHYDSTMERIRELRKKLSEVEIVWECEVDKEIKSDKEMKRFFETCHTKGRIDPRDAYFGGRTGPLALYSKATKEKTISYFDIISLYPSVNYFNAYPVGDPEIILPKDVNVKWKKPDDMNYNGLKIEGLLKVRVIPPKKLYLPVLPLRLPKDQRLLFSNCSACPKIFEKKSTKSDWKCPHDSEERSFTSTVTSIELAEALTQGYKVDCFYRAWHYRNWDSNLFKDYVRTFLKLKIEASPIPEKLKSDLERKAWAEEYEERFGIKIDLEKVKLNPGLRHISKLALNSLWGKFSQRNSLKKTVIVTDAASYFDYVLNPKYEVSVIVPIDQNSLRLVYGVKDEFIEEHKSSNIVLSLWTTSAARLALYKFMKIIHQTPGCKLLYTDTDSCIFEHLFGKCPISEGEFLGEMSREYPGFKIIEYICGGAKAYGLKLLPEQINEDDAEEGDYKYVVKLRGVTLDVNNCKAFNYQIFKTMVLNFGDRRVHQFNSLRIGPQRDSKVFSSEITKKYTCINQKNLIASDLITYPFGFH